jgi:hypothetical protein
LRAENSNTSRHLAEFWMIEPEIAFVDLSDNAALAEALLKYTFAALLRGREEDLAFFDQRIEKGLVATTRPRAPLKCENDATRGFLRLWGRRLLVNVGIQAALSARRKAVALQAAGPVWDDVTHGRAADNRGRRGRRLNTNIYQQAAPPEPQKPLDASGTAAS